MKRLIYNLMTITMAASLIAGCGNATDNNSSSGKETANDKSDTEYTEYAQAYMDKVLELDEAGTTDGYALIDVDGDDIPELAAANTAEEPNGNENAFLFTFYHNEVVELLTVSEGFDGNHIYVSEGNNVLLRTGSMSGNESYDLYSINGKNAKVTDNLMILADPETDSYTYQNGETEIDKETYIEDFDSKISTYNSFIGIDHDGLNEMNITNADGVIHFEELSSEKYLSLNEIKDKLTELGAK